MSFHGKRISLFPHSFCLAASLMLSWETYAEDSVRVPGDVSHEMTAHERAAQIAEQDDPEIVGLVDELTN